MRKRQNLSYILRNQNNERKRSQSKIYSIKLLENNCLDLICLTQHSYIKNRKIKTNNKQVAQTNKIDYNNYSNLMCSSKKIENSQPEINRKNQVVQTNKSYHYVKLNTKKKNRGYSEMKIYKQKQPLVRSFIIKDNIRESSMFYDCKNEQIKFNNSLNQCINREAILVDEANNKNILVQSFSNLRVKKGLMIKRFGKQDINMNSKKQFQVSNPQNSPRSTQNKFKSLQTDDKCIHNIQQRNRMISRIKNQNSPTQKSMCSTKIFDPSLSEKGNYNGYLMQGKQRKIRQIQKVKVRPETCIKDNSKKQQFFNVQMVKIYKNNQNTQRAENQSPQSENNQLQLKKLKTQQQQAHKTTQSSPIKIIGEYKQKTGRYTKVEQFTVFDQMRNSIKKRRISVTTSSPTQYKERKSQQYKSYLQNSQELEKDNICYTTFQQQKDQEQENSNYLKTINI